jgi:hypothetical protein
MTQNELNRAVARATGESVSTVKGLGFLIDGPSREAEDFGDAESAPQVIDWDQLDAERSGPIPGRPCCELALA